MSGLAVQDVPFSCLLQECNTLKEHRGKMEARLQEVETRLQEVEGENGSLADVNVKLDQSNTFLMGERNGLHYELATLNGVRATCDG